METSESGFPNDVAEVQILCIYLIMEGGPWIKCFGMLNVLFSGNQGSDVIFKPVLPASYITNAT